MLKNIYLTGSLVVIIALTTGIVLVITGTGNYEVPWAMMVITGIALLICQIVFGMQRIGRRHLWIKSIQRKRRIAEQA